MNFIGQQHLSGYMCVSTTSQRLHMCLYNISTATYVSRQHLSSCWDTAYDPYVSRRHPDMLGIRKWEATYVCVSTTSSGKTEHIDPQCRTLLYGLSTHHTASSHRLFYYVLCTHHTASSHRLFYYVLCTHHTASTHRLMHVLWSVH